MKAITLKLLTMLALTASTLTTLAAVGVTIGHKRMDPNDKLPVIRADEQVSVFHCIGRMSGPDALACSLKKCMNNYGIADNADETTIAKHCIPDGWSERNGYSVVIVGPRGDNRYLLSKALGDPTREEAMRYVRSNNFPVDKGRIVLDIYDDSGTPPPRFRTRGGASDDEGEGDHAAMIRQSSGIVPDEPPK